MQGRHLEVEEEKDLLKYTITVGGQKCNITGFGVSSPSVVGILFPYTLTC